MIDCYFIGRLDEQRTSLVDIDHPMFHRVRLRPCGSLVGEPWSYVAGQLLRINVVQLILNPVAEDTFQVDCLFNSVEKI